MSLAICLILAQSQSIVDPASPAARSIVDLAILVLAVAGLIFLVVEGVLFYSIWRFRVPADRPRREPPQVYGSRAIEVAWTAAPTLIVLFLTLVITRTLWEVEAAVPDPQPRADALFVTVTGRQWWWEYTYDSYDGRTLGFITANELHIPRSTAGRTRPVYLALKSADVSHSFWVPRLGGKVDLIPGRTNWLHIETDEVGVFHGQCAEYCGTQHANMLLRVYVDPPEQFDRWLEDQARPAVDDQSQREGRDTFLAQSCVNCHRVRGTPAAGTFGPDLTHLASRQTLAATRIENNRQNLAAWVRNPQAIKQGCLMPAFGLTDRQRGQIVAYLESLR